MIDTLADPALRGLEGRTPGSGCNTACKPDCTFSCHERHRPTYLRAHDQYYCDQIRLGRDVTEAKPWIRLRWAALARAANGFVLHEVTWRAAAHIAEDHGFTPEELDTAVRRARIRFTGHHRPHRRHEDLYSGFTAQKMPRRARLLARLRGFDA